MDAEAPLRMAPPPPAVLKVVNPVVRRLLGSPLAGRLPPSMTLLEYAGRRTGRRRAVPVGVHEVDGGGPVVFTEAPWRHNFAGGHDLTLRRGTSVRRGRGVLVTDPDAVADALAAAVATVGARGLAMRAAPGHRITREDLLRLGRGMVRVHLDG